MYRGCIEELRDPENEPPSLYTADQPPGGPGEDSSSETEEVGGEEGEEEEEEEWTSVEVRGRGRGAEFESSYLDYMALGRSRAGEQSQGEGEEAKTVGLFGTISSLFSSTFSPKPS